MTSRKFGLVSLEMPRAGVRSEVEYWNSDLVVVTLAKGTFHNVSGVVGVVCFTCVISRDISTCSCMPRRVCPTSALQCLCVN